jgi:hypothetical protein
LIKTAKPRRVLTPVTVTARYRSFRSGRLENWAAVSDDGMWEYKRLEISGTPWAVVHVPTGLEAGWCGTLTAARGMTADGAALAAVEQQMAQLRGEHATERNTTGVKC